ncbi:unnamed protein product, partial [Chrysoparadoxa australica]
IQVTVTDSQGLTDTKMMHIHELPENDPPVIQPAHAIYAPDREYTHDRVGAVIDSVPTLEAFEDTDFPLGNYLSVRDVDAQGGDLIEVTLMVGSGTLSLSTAAQTAVQSYIVGTGNADHLITLRATLAHANEALASLVYRGNEDYYGSDTLIMTVSDLGNTGYSAVCHDLTGLLGGETALRGGAPVPCPLSHTVSLPIDVAPLPDAPGITLAQPDGDPGNAFTPGLLVVEEDSDAALTITITERDGQYSPYELGLFITDYYLLGSPDLSSSGVHTDAARSWEGQVMVKISLTRAQLTLATTKGLTFYAGSGTANEMMHFQGHLQDVNTALHGCVYRADTHWNTCNRKHDKLQVTVSNSHIGLGGLEPEVAEGETTILVQVLPINDPPRVTVPVTALHCTHCCLLIWPTNSVQDEPLAIPGILVTDVDAGAGSEAWLTVTAEVDHGTLDISASYQDGLYTEWATRDNSQEHHKSLLLRGDIEQAALATLTYVSSIDWNGADSLRISASDGQAEATRVLPITVQPVNDAPRWNTPLDMLVCGEDQSLKITEVEVADPDQDETLTVTVSVEVGQVMVTAVPASLDYNDDGTGGRALECSSLPSEDAAINVALSHLLYLPQHHWTTEQSGLHFVVTDGQGTIGTTDLLVYVSSDENDPPQVHVPAGATYVEEPCESRQGQLGISPPSHPAVTSHVCRTIVAVDTMQVNEDVPLPIEGVYIEDADAEAQPRSIIQVTIQVLHGSITLPGASTAGVNWLQGTYPGTGELVAQGLGGLTLSTSISTLRLTSPGMLDWYGPDQMSITADDLGFTGKGGPMGDTAVIPIEVLAVNDPPVIYAKLHPHGSLLFPICHTHYTTLPSPLHHLPQVLLHNVTVYDADVHPLILHSRLLGMTHDPSDISSYPNTGDLPGGGMFRVTVSCEHGKVLFSSTRRLAFVEPSADAELLRRGATTHLGLDFAEVTPGAEFEGGELVGRAGNIAWWRAAQLAGLLDDINAALSNMVYWPDVNWHGSDLLTVLVEDLHEGDEGELPLAQSQVIGIRVEPVNDAPTITVLGSLKHATLRTPDLLDLAILEVPPVTTDEDTGVALEGISVRDVDEEDEDGAVDVTITAQMGDVSVVLPSGWCDALKCNQTPEANRRGAVPGLLPSCQQATSWLYLTSGDASGSSELSFTAFLSTANDVLSTMSFTPSKDYYGSGAKVRGVQSQQPYLHESSRDERESALMTHSMHAGADRGLSGTSGAGARSDTVTIPITIKPVNDAPEVTLPEPEAGSAVAYIQEEDTLRLTGARYDLALATVLSPNGHLPERHGWELWRAQGGPTGYDYGTWGAHSNHDWAYAMVADINDGMGSSSPSQFAVYNGMLFFQAYHPAYGVELWKSDGTSARTVLVKDLYPGTVGSNPTNLRVFDGALYFQANGIDTEWMTPFQLSDECDGFKQADFDERIRFAVSQSTTWEPSRRYDCPAGYHWASTAEAEKLFPATYNDETYDSFHRGHPLTYASTCGWDGLEWGGQSRTRFRLSDSHVTGAYKHAGKPEAMRPDSDTRHGTTDGFAGVVCVASDSGNLSPCWHPPAPLSGNTVHKDCRKGERAQGLCFQGAGAELWRTDGTHGGTARVDDTRPGLAGSAPSDLEVFDSSLFFSAHTELYGTELYRSQGSLGTSALVKDIRSGPLSSEPQQLTAGNFLNEFSPPSGALVMYFTADDGTHGRELWSTNGSLGY